MFPIILRSVLAAAASQGPRSMAIKRAVQTARIKSIPRKPNKILRVSAPKAQSQPVVPYSHPERINVPRRETSQREHPGNRAPIDTSSTSYFKNQSKESLDTAPAPPSPERQKTVDSTARLLATSQFLSQQLSSFIPSISWKGSITATGFKTTPLRTVLHYCLAAVFGLIHQTRIGHSAIHVDLHPNENRVDVVFINSSSLLLELFNVALVGFAGNPGDFLKGAAFGAVGNRLIGQSKGVTTSIFEFAKGKIDTNEAVKDIVDTIGEISRRIGPGGIWDMAQSDIYAGKPPGTMEIGKVEPFDSIYQESVIGKKPMLTRQLALNPQAPTIPNMHYPTHFDLRSLVAQALYDPGVMPPIPDTNVALPNVELS